MKSVITYHQQVVTKAVIFSEQHVCNYCRTQTIQLATSSLEFADVVFTLLQQATKRLIRSSESVFLVSELFYKRLSRQFKELTIKAGRTSRICKSWALMDRFCKGVRRFNYWVEVLIRGGGGCMGCCGVYGMLGGVWGCSGGGYAKPTSRVIAELMLQLHRVLVSVLDNLKCFKHLPGGGGVSKVVYLGVGLPGATKGH